HPWVSRGGVKLAHALDRFGIDPAGLLCLDIGASTGGFTDVLLARGDAEPDSDIDVMIVLRGPLDDWAETQRTSKVTSEVSMKFETVISRIFATPDEADENPGSFYCNVRSEGVLV
ncbi:MAG TPA: SAM-dependent methyltransferase, partial [Dongiaceae bacterium]|nr:SAM-dependent methyltransferase [Dongiaceae bacterium]